MRIKLEEVEKLKLENASLRELISKERYERLVEQRMELMRTLMREHQLIGTMKISEDGNYMEVPDPEPIPAIVVPINAAQEVVDTKIKKKK